MIRIAIIEDEHIDSDNIKKLVEESLGAEVKQAFNRGDAEALLSTEKFDLVIMDVELGSGSKNRFAGLGLLADVPATWPTIVVSGMPEENILRGLSIELQFESARTSGDGSSAVAANPSAAARPWRAYDEAWVGRRQENMAGVW